MFSSIVKSDVVGIIDAQYGHMYVKSKLYRASVLFIYALCSSPVIMTFLELVIDKY